MEIKHLDFGFPLILIDNYYNSEELSLIWEELSFLCYPHKLERASVERGGATTEDFKLLKFTNNTYLDIFYTDRKFSNILSVNRKLFENFQLIIKTHEHWFFKYAVSHEDYTQVVYYEDGDEYKPHQDGSSITALSWFYNEPKKFEGGNLQFPNFNAEIEVINNRMVIFPSIIFHGITPVKLEEKYKNKKYGRFCISQFIQNQMP